MNKITVAIGLVAALALPATAAAKPPATQEQKQAAHAQCKLERGKTKVTHEAFKAKYHSMSRCVRQNTAEEAAEEQAARTNASKECKAEAADPAFPTAPGHEGKSFAEFYGANANDKNAHGKCVSAKAKAKKAAMDEADAQEAEDFKNAAKACAEERRSLTADVFANKYGTNPNKRNAFGKCVSKLAASDA
jgi:hypothetical protein